MLKVLDLEQEGGLAVMATTFILMTSLKIATVFGAGLGISAAFQFFHTYELKPVSKKDKERGDLYATKISESLREKSRSVN